MSRVWKEVRIEQLKTQLESQRRLQALMDEFNTKERSNLNREMKTIAQQLNVTEFPFEIKDKNGNQIYWEGANRLWCKSEYDSNGNDIYFEDSNEWWSKREYDSNGNEIYYENSYGYIIDNRPKGCGGKVVEIDGKKYKLTELT